VTTAIGKHLQINTSKGSNVDEVEATFTAAILRAVELAMPPRERRRPAQR